MRGASVLLAALALAACGEEGTGSAPADRVTVPWEVEGSGIEPAGPVIDPSVILIRDERAVETAAANAPAEGAARRVRSWDRYEQRALLVVYGGTVSDAGHRVEVDGFALDGDRLIISAELTTRDPALQVVSIPWTAVSVDANLVARAETCALTLDGRQIPDAACSPAIP